MQNRFIVFAAQALKLLPNIEIKKPATKGHPLAVRFYLSTIPVLQGSPRYPGPFLAEKPAILWFKTSTGREGCQGKGRERGRKAGK